MGRQWYNRDAGYGLCDGCVNFVGSSLSAESMKSGYGVPGVHYALPKPSPASKAIARGRGVLHALGMLLEVYSISATKTKIKRLGGAEITLYQLVDEARQAYDDLEAKTINSSVDLCQLQADAARYQKLKRLVFDAPGIRPLAISKFNGLMWERFEASQTDLDNELDAINE